MRRTRLPMLTLFAPLALAGLTAAGCQDAPRSDDRPAIDPEVADRGPVAEDPGLPTDSTRFTPREGARDGGIDGTLWVSRSPARDADGISLVAQLRGVPARSYGWAVHRGGCDGPDDLVLALGWGTEANRGRSETGGPLGEMRPAFEPSLEGEVAETVWIPLDRDLDRATLADTRHSLRIHPEPGDDAVHPSVACAPIPVPEGADAGAPRDPR